jgi:hypothetical protein
MKKIVSTFAFALVLGGLTFADDAAPAVKIGAWGRSVFVPFVSGGNGADGKAASQSMLGVSWGGPTRVGITISGSSEFVGFQMDIDGNGGSIGGGDQQKIWVKPMSGLTLQFGQAFDDTLRGNTAFGNWDWIRLGPVSDEDNVFSRVNTQSGFEAAYSLDAIYVYGAFRGLANPQNLSKNVLNNLQIGAGYTIKDVGLIRVQALGTPGKDAVDAVAGTVDTTFEDLNGDGIDDTFDGTAAVAASAKVDPYQTIEAAFRLTAVQNLYVDVGIKYPNDSVLAGYASLINAYANYTADKAKIHGLVTYRSPAKGGEAFMGIGAGLDYGLDGGLGVGTDVRYYSQKDSFGDPTDPSSSLITFFAGITKGFSNGLVGIGIEYATFGGGAFGTTVPSWGNLNYNSDTTKAQILIPVRAEYWF